MNLNEKFKKKNPFYHSEYMKNIRIKAKSNNICSKCFKNKVVKGLSKCQECINRDKKWRKENVRVQKKRKIKR